MQCRGGLYARPRLSTHSLLFAVKRIDIQPIFHYFQDAHLLFKKNSCLFRKPTIWGRNGFDGDKEALVAYRVLIGS